MASAPSASKARAIAARLRPIASARGKQQRVLQLTTLAFFLSFVVWFNFAPFSVAIGKDLHLTPAQEKALQEATLPAWTQAEGEIGEDLIEEFKRVSAKK